MPNAAMQKFLKQVANGWVHHGLSDSVLDAAWQDVKKRTAGVIAGWNRRFPDRELFGSSLVFDHHHS